MIREVGVVLVVALMRMMFEMVNSEGHRSRHEVRKIGKDRDQLIPALALKNKVMDRIMNQDVHRMIRESPDAIRADQTQPPIVEAQLAKDECERGLQSDHSDGDQHRPRISDHQLTDFRMSPDDGTGAAG